VDDIISHAEGAGAFDSSLIAGTEPVRHIVGRNLSKADVFFYEIDGLKVAVKTYGPRGALVRNTFGRWMIARETAAYVAAAGATGLPAFFGRIEPFALATEWVDAEPLSSRTGENLASEVFDRVASQLVELHDRGVALSDLHHRDVLLAENGQTYLIDLATAWVLGSRPGILRRRVFERLRESDLVSVARMRARFTGGDPDAAASQVSSDAASWHQRGRWVKSRWDALRGKTRG
jgi:hypothetical protein